MATSADRKNLDNIYKNVAFAEAIDWWAAHYARDEVDVAISNARHLDPTRQAIENEVWRRIVPIDGRVLDLACGRGFFSRRLRDALGSQVSIVGVDLSMEILKVARSEQEGLSLALGTAGHLPFPSDSFDTVLLITAIEQMSDPAEVVAEIHRVLKSQGYLYLCLHKPFCDPFVLPRALKLLSYPPRCAYRILKRVSNPRAMAPAKVGYRGSLRSLRASLRGWFAETGFHWTESRSILYRLDWEVYRFLLPWAVPSLLRVGQSLNHLPFGYYKDLEYWLLQKT